jgi:hypothetical protein
MRSSSRTIATLRGAFEASGEEQRRLEALGLRASLAPREEDPTSTSLSRWERPRAKLPKK